MKKLKALQEQYRKGEITKTQYEAAVAKLLEDDTIDDEQHEEALDFDPEADKPVFTQADVDRMVAAKAVKMVRKALKDAGVELDASNKDLLTKVAELAKGGAGSDGKATDQDLAKLKQLEGKLPQLESRVKDLAIENAVLKAAGKYDPVNAVQVVRALKLDYMDQVDYDEHDGKVDTRSVETVLKQIYKAEPNLFKPKDGEEDNDDQGALKGKGPGGGTGGGKGKKDDDALLAQAREMLGITKKD